MLKMGGYINLFIAGAHVAALFFLREAMVFTGVGESFDQSYGLHPVLPYMVTVAVIIAFTLFGLYGLSAAGTIRSLPFVKPVVFLIAGIYLLRGVAGLAFRGLDTTEFLQLLFSLFALGIGLLYLLGGLKKWYWN